MIKYLFEIFEGVCREIKLSFYQSSLLFLLIVFSTTVQAHSPSSSYLFIEKTASNVSPLKLRWDIAIRDLELVIGIDSNQDQKISWKELQQKRQAITAYAFANLLLKQQQTNCQLDDIGLQVVDHSDGAYAVLWIQPNCDNLEEAHHELTLNYSLLFNEDSYHRGIILDQRNKQPASYIASPENNQFNLTNNTSSNHFLTFLVQGIWHILIGFDHILFVITLMLPAVLRYNKSNWIAVPKFKPAVLDLLKVVTAFTVAHSITLSLAILNIISLPSRWVESAIALSVIIVAINNIKPLFSQISRARLAMAFLFGLIHGFGFASVLNDLNLNNGSLLASLFGFNLGVEVGQSLILLSLFPIIFFIRKTDLYQTYILKGGSLIISLLATSWLVQRVML